MNYKSLLDIVKPPLVSSIVFFPEGKASVAQLVEHRFRKPEVRGSSPLAGSIKFNDLGRLHRSPFMFCSC